MDRLTKINRLQRGEGTTVYPQNLHIAAKAKEKHEREGRELGGTLEQKSDKGVIDTKKELAKLAGVSHDTLHRAAVIAEAASEGVQESGRDLGVDLRSVRPMCGLGKSTSEGGVH